MILNKFAFIEVPALCTSVNTQNSEEHSALISWPLVRDPASPGCIFFAMKCTHSWVISGAQFWVPDSNWALSDVQISFSPQELGGERTNPVQSPAGEGFSRFSHGTGISCSLGPSPGVHSCFPGVGHNCGFQKSRIPSMLPLPCIKILPVLAHPVLKSVTQCRERIQIKNTPQNRGMETGKGVMGQECPEPFLPWGHGHNPEGLGLLSGYQDGDYAAWRIIAWFCN